jgi:hypothetical protein
LASLLDCNELKNKKSQKQKSFTTMHDDNERTLFDYWQESLDEMWKSALDEDSEEEEFGTFSCGNDLSCGDKSWFRRVRAPVKEGGLDDHLEKVLRKVDDRNRLGAIFDDILLGFTPVEVETRNPSPTYSERHSRAKKHAVTKSSSPQKRRGIDGSVSLAPSLSLRKSGSLGSKSGSFSDSLKRRERSPQIVSS